MNDTNARVNKNIELSIVSAVYNEGKGIVKFLNELNGVLANIGMVFEIIIVDDASEDDTLEKAKSELKNVDSLKIVELYRNVGQVKALSAGMTVASGKWILMMDGDLQHDPKDIPVMIEKMKEGHDLVATYRVKRKEKIWRKAITYVGNTINRFLIGVDVKDFGSAYRLFDATLLYILKDQKDIVHYNTPKLYTASRNMVQIPIEQRKREFGSTKWKLSAFISYNLDFITASQKVAHLLIFLSIIGFIAGCFLYFCKLVGIFEDVEFISAPVSIAFLSLQLTMLAVIWREIIITQEIIKGTPMFMIKNIWKNNQ